MTFGDRLFSLMNARGMSNADLARKIGLQNPNQVSEWIGAIYPISPKNISKIAKALDVPVEALIEGVRNQSVPRTPEDVSRWLRVHARPTSSHQAHRPA